MHKVLVNRLGGLSLPRKSVVRLTDRPDMTIDVFRERKQQHNNNNIVILELEKTKGESESARCRSCSRVDFCSLVRINTAEKSFCMSYDFYFNFAKSAIELNVHVE